MSLQRKQIILNEIAFWKRNKLLPEHYCDFLTALYAQGETAEVEEKEKSSKAVLAKEKKKTFRIYLLLGIITAALLVSLLVITTFAFIPIILAGIIVSSFLFFAFKFAQKKSVMTPIMLVCSALLLLASSFKVWDVYFHEYPILLLVLIIANCLIWLFSGLLLKLVYFSISGIVGIVFICIYVFRTFF